MMKAFAFRLSTFALIAGLAAAAAPPAQAADKYPARPVRVVVAFAAGGFADGITRQVTQKLSESLGQQFVVDNRGGAGGNLGARIVAEATPDGYTLLTHTAASSINVSLYKDVGFHLLKDFTPVANTVSTPGILAVLASHPASSLKDLIARSKGRRLTYATAGVGTSSHISADYLLRVLAKLDAVHVPFKGGGPAVDSVVGNQVEVINTSAAAIPHIQAGRMKALGIASLTRVESFPSVPTIAEAGFPGFEERSWVGFFAPIKTPPAIVALLNKEINKAILAPDVAQSFKVRGMDAHPGSAADFRRYVEAEVAKWAKMVKLTGVKVE